MSFMFHPYPYSDPEAVNAVTGMGVSPVRGLHNVARTIAGLLREGKRVGIDVYPGTDVQALVNVLRQQCAAKDGGSGVAFVNALDLLKPAQEITDMLEPYLPMDREVDPVLLYGRRYKDGYPGLQSAEKVQALKAQLDAGGAALVYGQGALTGALRDSFDVRI